MHLLIFNKVVKYHMFSIYKYCTINM